MDTRLIPEMWPKAQEEIDGHQIIQGIALALTVAMLVAALAMNSRRIERLAEAHNALVERLDDLFVDGYDEEGL